LTQWLCSTSSSLSLYSPSSAALSLTSPSPSSSHPSDLHESWSIIWLDRYETIHPRRSSDGHAAPILDSDTFHEVLETKKPNYINLVEFEDGVSYQVFYWPLFSSDSMTLASGGGGGGDDEAVADNLKHSFLSHEGSNEERTVIAILQCQIRKDSSDPSTFLEQSLAQPLFLSYFNQLLTQIYPHLFSADAFSGSHENCDDDDDIDQQLGSTHRLPHHHHPIDSSLLPDDEFQVILSNNFFADLSALVQQTLLLKEQGEGEEQEGYSKEFMRHLSQVIWDHSSHTQIYAVGVFLMENDFSLNQKFLLGTIRSAKLRSIQLNDDEDNQSISIQFNPNR
jgi:hypothetical protein